jgi:hypothetical protein
MSRKNAPHDGVDLHGMDFMDALDASAHMFGFTKYDLNDPTHETGEDGLTVITRDDTQPGTCDWDEDIEPAPLLALSKMSIIMGTNEQEPPAPTAEEALQWKKAISRVIPSEVMSRIRWVKTRFVPRSQDPVTMELLTPVTPDKFALSPAHQALRAQLLAPPTDASKPVLGVFAEMPKKKG